MFLLSFCSNNRGMFWAMTGKARGLFTLEGLTSSRVDNEELNTAPAYKTGGGEMSEYVEKGVLKENS